ncbi:hypothetical protein [Terriglobus saanensis]|nr:hypothetical protein [Terriglobus saanensis]
MSVHVERFSGRVAEYAQYRERYDPFVALPLLEKWCGLVPDWTVADIAAGTGTLSDVFLANGHRVIAVGTRYWINAGRFGARPSEKPVRSFEH